MKNTVIFDLDGTLINSLHDIHSSVNHVLCEMGFPERTFDYVKSTVGEGAYRLMELCLPENTDKKTQIAAGDAFKAWYAGHGNIETKPYDGIMDMLKVLKKKGINTAISSNKYGPMVKALSDDLFGDLIGIAIGECETVAKKPDPSSAYAALEYFGVQKKEALYVGDSEVDIETAKNAGIDLICVTWGARTKDFLIKRGAKNIIDNADALLKEILARADKE